MGMTCILYKWKKRGDNYNYYVVWEGESLFKALWKMWRLSKEEEHPSFKLEWSP